MSREGWDSDIRLLSPVYAPRQPSFFRHSPLSPWFSLFFKIAMHATMVSVNHRELKGKGGADRFRERTGLPISPYFSATKLLWLMKNVPGLEVAAVK